MFGEKFVSIANVINCMNILAYFYNSSKKTLKHFKNLLKFKL